jgi:hypothetical protein
MAYDSPSDSEDNLYDLCLTGEFDQVDSLLRDGEPIGILDSPTWDYFMKELLSMEDWRDKLPNIQLLYIYKCIRQLDSTDQPAVYIMELRCNVKSWVFTATFDEELFVERLGPYVPRFDAFAMQLYEDVLAFCRVIPTHDVLVPETAILR